MSIIVSGTADVVHLTLHRIAGIIQDRKVNGWPLFQDDEEWLYVTRPDIGEVCPVCEGHSGVIFSGDQVQTIFPYKQLWTTDPFIVLPRTHMPNLEDFANEPCHCEMHLLHAAETMEKRLHEEKLAVV